MIKERPVVMNIAICDDDKVLCSSLETQLWKLGKKHNVSMNISVFFDGQTFWNAIQQNNDFDLIFLDILMDNMNGITVGQAIRNVLGDEECKIVYISVYDEYAMDLFAIRPMDFLIKPINEEKLEAIWELYNKLHHNESKYFCYLENGNQKYIVYQRILYFRADNRKVEIHTTDGDVIKFYDKISEVRKQTESSKFVQISRSELVNYQAIDEYKVDEILLRNGERLPIVSSRRKEVGKLLLTYMGEMM